MHVTRGLIETVGVVLLGEGHLHGHGMHSHDRNQACRLGGCGLFHRFVDHLQTTVALLAKPEMIGVAEVDLKIGFLTRAQRFLEDVFEFHLDGVCQSGYSIIAAGLLRPALHQRALGLLEELAQPGHSSRAEVGIGDDFLDVAEQALDMPFQCGFISGELDLKCFDTHPHHAVDSTGNGGQLDATSPSENLVARLLVTGADRQSSADQILPKCRGVLRLEHLEMPPDLRHIG